MSSCQVGAFGRPLAQVLRETPPPQGSQVGTLDELRELVALVKRTGMKAIPVARRPLSDANAALQDLQAGRVVGRAILLP